MAGLAVLERERIVEREHAENIRSNYLKLLDANFNLREENAPVTTENKTHTAEESVVRPAERLASYVAVAPTATRRNLFEGITYKDGVLTDKDGVLTEDKKATSQIAVAPALAPTTETTEEDALPTPRTMETLRQNAMQSAVEEVSKHAGFFASISTKTKVILAAVVTAIILLFTLICVNTGIINGLDSNLETLRARYAEQTETYAELQEELGSVDELVQEWAQANGYVLNN